MNKWKATYYLSTVVLSVFMLFSAYVELIQAPSAVALFVELGYPSYLLYILGVAKILGVIGIWQPIVPFLREWAYAGFVIDVSGALASHVATGGDISQYGLAVVFLGITLLSYASFRRVQLRS